MPAIRATMPRPRHDARVFPVILFCLQVVDFEVVRAQEWAHRRFDERHVAAIHEQKRISVQIVERDFVHLFEGMSCGENGHHSHAVNAALIEAFHFRELHRTDIDVVALGRGHGGDPGAVDFDFGV